LADDLIAEASPKPRQWLPNDAIQLRKDVAIAAARAIYIGAVPVFISKLSM